MKDELRAIITPAVEKLSETSGDDVEVIFSEIEKHFDAYVNAGTGDPKDEMGYLKTALNTTKTSYRKIVRLNAEMFEGFFIGSTATDDSNKFDRNNATKLLDKFIVDGGYNPKMGMWKPEAKKAGLIDDSGEVTYSQAFIDEFKNGNEKLSWMLNRKIGVNMRKQAWGFFRRFNSDEEYEMLTCYISDPDNFVPKFGVLYKFRATLKTGFSTTLTFHKDVSKLNYISELSYDDIEAQIGSIGDNIKMINSVYDFEIPMAIQPESPAPKFWITNAVIGSFETTGYGMTKLAVIDQFGEFEDEEVEMDLPTEYADGLHEGLAGILVYRPFIRRGKESKGEIDGAPIATGNALGFIPDPKFMLDFTVPIVENDEENYTEEY